jgi:UPF0716 protein FxsA
VGLLFLAFVLLPFAELYVLIRIGGVVGLWPTLFGIIVVGALGAYFAKRQGLRVMRDWQAALAEGRMPEEGMLGGLLTLLGGLLLIMPGIISDFLGLVLLLPFTRRLLVPIVRGAIEKRMQRGTIRVVGFPGRPPRGDGVIDTTGEDVSNDRPRFK